LTFRGWVREPILHFLLIGCIIFGVYAWMTPDVDDRVIKVDNESLVRFIQFRTKNFSPQAQQKLKDMSSSGVEDIIRQFVREEALYRKALSYGMGRDDYVIKQRLIQKVEFLAQGTSDDNRDLSEAELRDYYGLHQDRYKLPATVTFTHVFFSSKRHGVDVDRLAKDALAALNQNGVRFDQAPEYGERFAYQLNYVERSKEEVASHFGENMASALFQLEADANTWRGIFRSEFGSHVALLTDTVAARIPDFNEVQSQVADEFVRERTDAERNAILDSMIEEYQVDVAPEFQRHYREGR
jgi:parvulin-like peptidyl-prolyl isomerase